jgi:alpha-tubulin suppressor-like RCC1 family protein
VSAPSTGAVSYTQIGAGRYHLCALTTTGQIYCWGRGDYGAIGNGANVNRDIPTRIADPSTGPVTWRQISAGLQHNCALTTAGVGYCWGQAQSFGDGQWPSHGGRSNTPRRVANPASGPVVWQQIESSTNHACALTTGGAVYCWGLESSGQIGNGSSGVTVHDIPVAVLPPLSGPVTYREISAGSGATCGVTTDGRLFCWGWHMNNGTGLGVDELRPVELPDPPGEAPVYRSIIAGNENACALSDDNSLFCWGRSFEGSLGRGYFIGSSSPVRVGYHRWSHIAMSPASLHVMGIRQ